MNQRRLGLRTAGLTTWLLAIGMLAGGTSLSGEVTLWAQSAGPTGVPRLASPPVLDATSSEHLGPNEWQQSSGRPGTAEAGGSRRLLVRLPRPHSDSRGELIVRPQVQVVPIPASRSTGGSSSAGGSGSAGARLPSAEAFPGSSLGTPASFGLQPPPGQGLMPEVMPAPQGVPLDLMPGETIYSEDGMPMFGSLVQESLHSPQHHRGSFLSRILGSHRNPYEDRGLGHERVALAPMELDITQPMNNLRFRFDNAYGLEFPDRAEFYWAKIGGRGPAASEVAAAEQVDYQDIRYMWEIGGPSLSVQTELPLRFIDGENFFNTAGLGDMSITTKLLMLNGRRWQVTQTMRTYLPTGAPGHGLGNGHTSLEPGFLFRYMWNDATYLHGEMKYWIPLGGDPNHSGQVFRWGAGISHLWYESDSLAIIPTLEMVSWTVMDGRKTGHFDFSPVSPIASEVDGETTVNLYSGLRTAWDTGGDLGLIEFGLQGGFAITETSWYSSMLRFETRFVY